MWKRVKFYTMATLISVAYFVSTMFIFKSLEADQEWTYIDSLYFVCTCASTVGYGDLAPTNTSSRYVTVIVILIGICVVFPLLSEMVCTFTAPVTRNGRALLEWMFPTTKVDLDGKDGDDFEIPRHPVIYYSKNLLPSILMNLFVQLTSAVIYCLWEQKWSFGESFYHCLVTATTVGFGDIPIQTQGARLWASGQMMVSVCLLAELLGTFSVLSEQRKQMMAKVERLQASLDSSLIKKLMTRAKQMRRVSADADVDGITELEYALAMLIELDMVNWSDVEAFIIKFRTMDASMDGRLSEEDVQIMSAGTLRTKTPEAPNFVRATTDKLFGHRDPLARGKVLKVLPAPNPLAQEAALRVQRTTE